MSISFNFLSNPLIIFASVPYRESLPPIVLALIPAEPPKSFSILLIIAKRSFTFAYSGLYLRKNSLISLASAFVAEFLIPPALS